MPLQFYPPMWWLGLCLLNVTFDRRHEIMKPCLTKIYKITHFYQVVQNEKVTKKEGKRKKEINKERKKDFREKFFF